VVIVARVLVIRDQGELAQRFEQVGDLHLMVRANEPCLLMCRRLTGHQIRLGVTNPDHGLLTPARRRLPSASSRKTTINICQSASAGRDRLAGKLNRRAPGRVQSVLFAVICRFSSYRSNIPWECQASLTRLCFLT
jgi:hypothetical protein